MVFSQLSCYCCSVYLQKFWSKQGCGFILSVCIWNVEKKRLIRLNNDEQGLYWRNELPLFQYIGMPLPHIDVFENNGYTKEAMKIINVTHKILDPDICITSNRLAGYTYGRMVIACVVVISMEKDFSLNEVSSNS